MRAAASLFFLALTLGFGVASNGPPVIAPTDPLKPEEERKLFKLPPGFEAQLVAAEPDIHKPMNLAFDDRGRLWVTETVEYPFPARDGAKPRDAVKILEDFGPDGRARKITTYAEGLNIPIGLLPLPGGGRDALVYSIPQISLLHDSTGIGRADQRSPFLGTFGFKDTHGMTNSFTWNFDGWVHACHGFANQSEVKGQDGTTLPLQSGNTYRVKPDGSRLEWYTHGQVNPFGLTLDPFGNVYSADCHSQPIYQLLRGGYYPSFGKPHDGLGYAPVTTTEDHGGTGIAGIVYYAANHFPAQWQGTVFVGNVVTNRINHDHLTWQGSSPRAKRGPDFLVSDDPWFRPVDLKLGPDGALYVADFYNCIIGHYEVDLRHPRRDRERGRIWRIVYKGPGAVEAKAPRADWTKAEVGELINDLGHANLTVRVLATNELVRRGGNEVTQAAKVAARTVKKEEGEPEAWRRAHSLWVLERCHALDKITLMLALRDEAVPVRVHAQRILAEREKWKVDEQAGALAGLHDGNPHVRRAAADALGRHPSFHNVAPLLQLRHAVPKEDAHLLHVVRMALRDQLADSGVLRKLSDLSDRDFQAVADVVVGVANGEGARFLINYFDRLPRDNESLGRNVHYIARRGNNGETISLVEKLRTDGPKDPGIQAALLKALERGTQERGGRLAEAAHTWAGEVAGKLTNSKFGKDVLLGIELIGTMRLEKQQDFLAEVALRAGAPDNQRGAAMAGLANLDARKSIPVLGKVLADAEASYSLREQAGMLLARANRSESLAEIVKVLPVAPARLQNALAASLVNTPPGVSKLLDAVAAGKASARLLQERAVAVRLEKNFPDQKGRVEKLTRGLPPADQKVQELLKNRRAGYLKAAADPVMGKKIFEKSCAVCHQLANQGARFGPQLDGIGLRGIDRLLEDTLDPNRNVDQAFRTTVLNLKNGQVLAGLMVKEEGAVLVMADAQGKEVRVPKNQVEERLITPLSPMPGNFAEQLSEPDYYHLLAFLLGQRASPGK